MPKKRYGILTLSLILGSLILAPTGGVVASTEIMGSEEIWEECEEELICASPKETIFLIDSTTSMTELIDSYKAEARVLAGKILEGGGRVALYDYRDYDDEYPPYERCNFDTCTLETFTKGLSEIWTNRGGDIPESLLWSARLVLENTTWQTDATKSIVVLTDAFYHPTDVDPDKTTLDDVLELTRAVGGVRFFVITEEKNHEDYQQLIEATDGAVASITHEDMEAITGMVLEKCNKLIRRKVTTTKAPTETSEAIILKTPNTGRGTE